MVTSTANITRQFVGLTQFSRTQCTTQACGKMRMCGCADVRMSQRVKCGGEMRIFSADVTGKMRMCGYKKNLNSLYE